MGARKHQVVHGLLDMHLRVNRRSDLAGESGTVRPSNARKPEVDVSRLSGYKYDLCCLAELVKTLAG